MRQVCCILLAGLWAIAQALAQPEPRAVVSREHRCIFVVDTSFSMKRVASGLQAAIVELIANGAQGRLQSGDIVEIWTFNEEARTDRFPAKLWTPELAPDLSEQALDFIKQEHFQKQGQVARAVAALDRAIQWCPGITVMLLTDGEEDLRGTPFTPEARREVQRRYRELRQAKRPFLVTLEARNGRWVGCAVNAPREAITLRVDRIAIPESVPPPPATESPERQPPEPPPLLVARQAIDPPSLPTLPAIAEQPAAPIEADAPAPAPTPTPQVKTPVAPPPPVAGTITPRQPDAPETPPGAETSVKPATEKDPAPPTTPEEVPLASTPPQAPDLPVGTIPHPASHPSPVPAESVLADTAAAATPPQAEREIRREQAAQISPPAGKRGLYLAMGAALLIAGLGLAWRVSRPRRPVGPHSLISQSLDRKGK